MTAIQRKEHTTINPIVIFLSFLILTDPSLFCVLTNHPRIIPIPVPARDPSVITMRISNASMLFTNSVSLALSSLLFRGVFFPAVNIFFEFFYAAILPDRIHESCPYGYAEMDWGKILNKQGSWLLRGFATFSCYWLIFNEVCVHLRHKFSLTQFYHLLNCYTQ